MPDRAPRKPRTKAPSPQPEPQAEAQTAPLAHLGNQAMGMLAGTPGGPQALLAAQAGAGNQAVQRTLQIGTIPVKKVPANVLEGLSREEGGWLTARAVERTVHVHKDWDAAKASAKAAIAVPLVNTRATDGGEEAERQAQAHTKAMDWLHGEGWTGDVRVEQPALRPGNCHGYTFNGSVMVSELVSAPLQALRLWERNLGGATPIVVCLQGNEVAHSATLRGGRYHQRLPEGPTFSTTRVELDNVYGAANVWELPAQLAQFRDLAIGPDFRENVGLLIPGLEWGLAQPDAQWAIWGLLREEAVSDLAFLRANASNLRAAEAVEALERKYRKVYNAAP